ncbi:S-adenosyl-L-methionine-dependent methyltransferase [Hypoxylon sp. NC1633]|nr:S-adenosyl-L-methionine-dependent methyltransferase [Hypoxylon sp. NC1633]
MSVGNCTEDVFTNDTISASLVGNDGLDIYSASGFLTRYLTDSTKGSSYASEVTDLDGRNAPQGDSGGYPGVFGAELQKVRDNADDKGMAKRPEHRIFGLGVCLELSALYPELKFVVQDREPVLKQAHTEVWLRENPAAQKKGRVHFVEHDFFKQNPTKNADIYWLRCILHDYAIMAAMGPKSRILICDRVMNTTIGCKELKAAPAPLPANWGYHKRQSHQLILGMMTIINGIDRKEAC